jgi:hypothetical protein
VRRRVARVISALEAMRPLLEAATGRMAGWASLN